jgi:GNAT superfamily N-acetyltransferase
MTTIRKVDTSDPHQVEAFVRLPFRLYRESRLWVPPLLSSARKQLNRDKHPFYRHSDADFFLAEQGREVVGRIAVLEPRRRNAYRSQPRAFFCHFDAVEDLEVARALFAAAFDWARARGLEWIAGPEGFLPGDSLGVLVKGFEHHPAMGITYNFSYYDALIQDSGLVKQTDYHSCYLPGSFVLPERVSQIAQRAKEQRGYRVLRFRTRDELRAIAPRVIEAYNAAFAENREFVPIVGEDAAKIADRLISITQPDLIKVVAKGEQIVGFTLGFPDVWEALRRCRGRLYPLGWALLLREARRTRWVNFNGGGILPQYQGLGVNAILYDEMYRTVRERGFQHIDIVQVNEQNERMMRELQGMGADFYKTHRIYERRL